MKLCKNQCDRCGNEYKPEDKDNHMEIRFEKDLPEGHMYIYEFSHIREGSPLDLCKFCYKSFKQWWNAT